MQTSILYLIYPYSLYSMKSSSLEPIQSPNMSLLILHDGLHFFITIGKPYKKSVQHLWLTGGINKRIQITGKGVTKISWEDHARLLISPIFPVMPEGYNSVKAFMLYQHLMVDRRSSMHEESTGHLHKGFHKMGYVQRNILENYQWRWFCTLIANRIVWSHVSLSFITLQIMIATRMVKQQTIHIYLQKLVDI